MRGLDDMKTRMLYYHGKTLDGLNVDGKWRSFNSALENSYQAEWIIFNKHKHRCLINPDKLKPDYDQKEISVNFDCGLKEGDTFYWPRTKTHWIIYLQEHSEEAYFRAAIRRCDYQLEVGENKYWIYLRGPVETALIWRQKHGIETNDLNYSIMFYIQKNDETLEYLSRFNIIKFDGHNWRVAATNKYSQPNLIEVYLEEYFDNKIEDMRVKDEAQAKIEKVLNPEFEGPDEVRPYDVNIEYTIKNLTSGTFVVNSSKVKVNQTEDNKCLLDICTGKSGEFILSYVTDDVTEEYTIKIKSL